MRQPDGAPATVRADVYTLHYDDGVSEDVRAVTPSAAVAGRARKGMMPNRMTNRTLLDGWCRRRTAQQQAAQKGA